MNGKRELKSSFLLIKNLWYNSFVKKGLVVLLNEYFILLEKMYRNIFPIDEDISDFEKRKIIFDYLVDNIEYDYELLHNIKHNNNTTYRHGAVEILDVLKNKKGICNSIAQVYKLLLEKAGIYSICFICDDTTSVMHQINLVKTEDSYSFDDITSVIVKRGSSEEFFNYDLEDAKKNSQGMKELKGLGTNFVGLPSELIYYFIGADNKGINYSKIKDLNYDESSFKSGLILPNNIIKYQEKVSKKL